MSSQLYRDIRWIPKMAIHRTFEAIPCFQELQLMLVRKVLNATEDEVTAKNNNVIVGLMTKCKEVFPKE